MQQSLQRGQHNHICTNLQPECIASGNPMNASLNFNPVNAIQAFSHVTSSFLLAHDHGDHSICSSVLAGMPCHSSEMTASRIMPCRLQHVRPYLHPVSHTEEGLILKMLQVKVVMAQLQQGKPTTRNLLGV